MPEVGEILGKAQSILEIQLVLTGDLGVYLDFYALKNLLVSLKGEVDRLIVILELG